MATPKPETLNPQQELNNWLAERGYIITVAAVSPSGAPVPIVDFLPARWGVQVQIGKRPNDNSNG